MTEVYCHRGYSGLYPENTMLAFQKAIQTGADGIELDVHLTRDGEVVVFHDERLDRVTDGIGFLKDSTLKELKKLDASGTYRGKVALQRIPTLREYFELVAPTGMKTNIEFKTGLFEYPGLEEKVWELVLEYGQENRVLFSSFHGQTLLRLKRIAPEVPCGLLHQNKLLKAGTVVRDLGLECYHPMFLQLTPEVIRDLKDHNRRINTYTPNGRLVLRYLMKREVDAVITNFPERAMKLRQKIQGKTVDKR